jgi:hypothetical protein
MPLNVLLKVLGGSAKLRHFVQCPYTIRNNVKIASNELHLKFISSSSNLLTTISKAGNKNSEIAQAKYFLRDKGIPRTAHFDDIREKDCPTSSEINGSRHLVAKSVDDLL